ncbi:MAG: M50 family metallopeptidase [Chloroflexaceae bacterium]|nr:M50 family metallopeptidase [Chloroflexaceae bacterium]
MNMTSFFQQWRYREVLIVIALVLLSLVLAHVPLLSMLFYPFELFNTFIHELSHGIAAILTGGRFVRFEVRPNLSGTAWSAGGIGWIVTSAGYLGSAIFGGFLLLLSAWGVSARAVLMGLGVTLGVLCLLFVRNLFGIATGLLLSASLFLAGTRLPARWAGFLLLFLAVQAMLNAFESVIVLFVLSTRHGHVTTDAQIMASMTGIPAPFWAVLWMGIALLILLGSLSLAYRNNRLPGQA